MQVAPFIPAWNDLRPFSAEVWLVATIVGVLLVPFGVRKPNTAVGVLALLGFVGAAACLAWVGPHPGGRFGAMLAADRLAYTWKLLLLVFAIGLTLLWWGTTRHHLRQGDATEFFVLILSATLGMALMASACNLLMVYLAVELASLPSYVLVGFRKSHRPGAEAALKYVLFGAAASAVMVWGLSVLYAYAGTLNLYWQDGPDGVAAPGVAAVIGQVAHFGAGGQPLAIVAVLAVLAGIGFKIAAAPFHLWCPDVFEGAEIDVTTFLSVASKGAGLILTFRLVAALSGGYGATPAFWGETLPATTVLGPVLAVVSGLTCTLGNTAAYVQTNLKRLLAYSSIAHAGYMLAVVSLLGKQGSALTGLSSALLFYLAVYLFMNLGAFAVVAAVESSGDRSRRGATLDDFAGLGSTSPLAAACLAICLFGLIGVPPLAGFTAKFNILALLATAGGGWWALFAIILVNTVLSAYYYLRVVRVMYLNHGPLHDGDVAAESDSRVESEGEITPGVGFRSLASRRLAVGLGCVAAVVTIILFVGSNALIRWTSLRSGVRADEPIAGGAKEAGLRSGSASASVADFDDR